MLFQPKSWPKCAFLGSLVLVVLFYLNPSSAVYRWPLSGERSSLRSVPLGLPGTHLTSALLSSYLLIVHRPAKELCSVPLESNQLATLSQPSSQLREIAASHRYQRQPLLYGYTPDNNQIVISICAICITAIQICAICAFASLKFY